MNQSPLQLEYSIINNFHIDSNEAYIAPSSNPFFSGYDEAEYSSKIDVATHAEDNTKFLVKLRVWLSPTESMKPPYTFDITVTGFFKVSAEIAEEKRRDIVTINGPAVLYGTIRELVAQMTSRGPLSQMILPTVNFIPQEDTTKPKA
jgi:preprotein translocase subunit SecB